MIDRVRLDDFNEIPTFLRVGAKGSLDVLLDRVRWCVRRFVVISDAQAVAITLWVAHTHVLDATSTTPYLHVTSAEAESGKSRLLEVLELLVPRPLSTAGSVTVAVMYRAIEKLTPTLLLDEADNVLKDRTAKAELLGVLNNGYRRGQPVLRMGGPQHDRLDSFETFCAKAIAGLDDLPPTLASRCLRIELRRRHLDEHVDDFYRDEAHHWAAPLRDELAAWAESSVETLRAARPARLGVRDRLEEGLRLLLAIAELAGEEWSARARRSLLELAATSSAGAETHPLLLLRDIRDVLTETELATTELLRRLFAVETSPWADWWADGRSDEEPRPSRGAAMKLARMLKPFGISPKKIGPKHGRRNGYRLEDFADAFARYLPAEVGHVGHSAQPSQTSEVPSGTPEEAVSHLRGAVLCSTKPSVRPVRLEPGETESERKEATSNGRPDGRYDWLWARGPAGEEVVLAEAQELVDAGKARWANGWEFV